MNTRRIRLNIRCIIPADYTDRMKQRPPSGGLCHCGGNRAQLMVNFFLPTQCLPDVVAIFADGDRDHRGHTVMTTIPNDPQADIELSVIAELAFIEEPPINFARLVADLDSVLARLHAKNRQLTWDCEDVAIFDMPGTRIALAYNDSRRASIAATLTLSVGPSLVPAVRDIDGPEAAQHDVLCSKLVERVQARLKPDAIVWHETNAVVTVEVIDSLSTPTPLARPRRSADHPIYTAPDICSVDESYTRGHQRTYARPQRPPPRQHDRDLSRVRAALYPARDLNVVQQNSPQMRLAAHAMNATLITVSLPLGVAVLGYGLIAGDNMRLTSRLMVLTGCMTAFSRSEIAQQMVAFGGI